MSYYELPAEGRGYYLFKRGTEDTGAHFHSAPEFVFVRSGRLEANVGGERRVLTAGQACFSDSFCIHSYSGIDGDLYVLLGDREYFDAFFRERGDRSFPRFFAFSDFDMLDALYGLCMLPRDEKNARTVFSGAAEILLGCLAESVPPVEARVNKQSAFVCEVLEFAAGNLSSDLSLGSVSARFGYSEAHFSRLLRRYLGEGWNAYVNRLRARRAHAILQEEGTRSVLETAYECGFDSPSTFYRAYKREFGRQPRRK